MSRMMVTPLGSILACADEQGIARLAFADSSSAAKAAADDYRGGRHLSQLADELARYFAGHLTVFTVPLSLPTGTLFQRAAWAYLRSVPFGQTRTYAQQATGMRAPNAARAVGRANGANPLCLLLPCHRIVGVDGSLTGFAAGIDRKRWLLDHERRVAAGSTAAAPSATLFT